MASWESVRGSAASSLKRYPPDKGIGPYLKSINGNPYVTTMGSCSGLKDDSWEDPEEHGGHPYIWVGFKDRNTALYYVGKLLGAGYQVKKVTDKNWPIAAYIDISGTTNGRRMGGRRATPGESHMFWSNVSRILSRQPSIDRSIFN